ncbi:hypothetical protein A3K63_00280 [Candidatus Micrarchaeota archaeon RBG_16_49_10]|nr:MAG: hypothetical protein A3K63_00280 [Candidatus Micrarchaeota archaeon RBG_16_49_10]
MSQKSQKEYETILPEEMIREIDRVSKLKKFDEKKREKLTKEVQKVYLNSAFEPGEAVGIIAAQSISEPATQMTMRTYHFAGSAGMQITLGLPRLIEVFDARKEPTTPTMTIYLKKEFNDQKNSEKIAKKIKEKRLKGFVESVSLDLTNKVVKIKLKPEYEKKFEKITEILKLKFKKYKMMRRHSVIDVSVEDDIEIKELQRIKKKVLESIISGIPKITNTVVFNEGKDWVIRTLGSNFEKLVKIEEIDFYRSYTNNIHEVAETLGIEAARSVLLSELNSILEQQGLEVDKRHLTLIVDIMTFEGAIEAVGRYGVAGSKASILTRAGFEETVKHLVRASVRNEADNFNGLFENIMVNQQIPVGTGMFDLIVRMEDE